MPAPALTADRAALVAAAVLSAVLDLQLGQPTAVSGLKKPSTADKT
jgi:hypothetical protein